MSQIEIWEDANVMSSDSMDETKIHEPIFAYQVAHEMLPDRIEALDAPLVDSDMYRMFFENLETTPRTGLAGICVAIGFDSDRIYADLPGLAEDDTIYYADIYEVGHPKRGHNTLAFTAMISDRIEDEFEERDTLQFLYDRARILFAEETEITEYYT